MSVTTTADENLDTARGCLKGAVSALGKAIDPETWGSDDWTPGFKSRLRHAYGLLSEAYDGIKG